MTRDNYIDLRFGEMLYGDARHVFYHIKKDMKNQLYPFLLNEDDRKSILTDLLRRSVEWEKHSEKDT